MRSYARQPRLVGHFLSYVFLAFALVEGIAMFCLMMAICLFYLSIAGFILATRSAYNEKLFILPRQNPPTNYIRLVGFQTALGATTPLYYYLT